VSGPRIVGLFEGYGGLTMGVQQVIGGELVAYAEWEPPKYDRKNDRMIESPQAPARLLAHLHPDLPNLGDVSLVDWSPWVGKVDVLAGGFPCQDVSHAGLRAGMAVGTRSGLWYEFARAINELRPQLVVIENVPGLRTARAGDPEEVTDEEIAGGLEPDDGMLGEPPRDGRPVLRALGAVLGDLAELGFDAEWVSLRASDLGASHRRERVFIAARPADR
jgi:DNA (cytosine-5)-methyltransferase 1